MCLPGEMAPEIDTGAYTLMTPAAAHAQPGGGCANAVPISQQGLTQKFTASSAGTAGRVKLGRGLCQRLQVPANGIAIWRTGGEFHDLIRSDPQSKACIICSFSNNIDTGT